MQQNTGSGNSSSTNNGNGGSSGSTTGGSSGFNAFTGDATWNSGSANATSSAVSDHHQWAAAHYGLPQQQTNA